MSKMNICAECKYAIPPAWRHRKDILFWKCSYGSKKEVHPISGRFTLELSGCWGKNYQGNCGDWEAKK